MARSAGRFVSAAKVTSIERRLFEGRLSFALAKMLFSGAIPEVPLKALGGKEMR